MHESVAKQRKKVLLLVTKSNWGGAQRYVYDLATHLPTELFDVVVAAGGDGSSEKEGVLLERLRDARIRTVHLPSLSRDISPLKDLMSLRALVALCNEEAPDIIHANSSKAGGLGALAARLTGVQRIVFTAHGWPFWEERPRYDLFLRRLFSWATMLLSHVTICISNADAHVARAFPFSASKVHVIRNGISEPTFFERGAARALLFPEWVPLAHEKNHWVVTIAEHTANKNLFRALDAVAAYNERHPRRIFYTLIGNGEHHALLREHARKLRLESYVYFAGFVPDARRLLRAFDTFFLPSLKEGVPYVLLEAKRAGLPIVASKVGGIPELLDPSMTLVSPKDTKSIVLALERASCLHGRAQEVRSALDMALDTSQVY